MNLEEARKLAEGVLAAQEGTITIGDMKFVVNAEAPPLARCVIELADEAERLGQECTALHTMLEACGERRQKLADEVERLREIGERLLEEYRAEEEEYGFPFNFALRDAHADLGCALYPKEGKA